MYVQYLERGDLVFEHFLGFVEVWQHVLRLPAVDGTHLVKFPLVPLRQLLLMSPEEREEWSDEFQCVMLELVESALNLNS